MELITTLNSAINNIVWGPPMLILLVGTGLMLTIRLKGLQFSNLIYAHKMIFMKNEGSEGDITNYQALTTALAATIGTGNIAGVATAIAAGGPGAVFWMWVTGLVGMATKYAEAVLAVKYRSKDKKGEMSGCYFCFLWCCSSLWYWKHGTGQLSCRCYIHNLWFSPLGNRSSVSYIYFNCFIRRN